MERNRGRQENYEDIIHLPHPVSARHPQMSRADRAAQFSPFAALTGYGDAVREQARLTEEKPELSEEERSRLDDRLRQLCSPQLREIRVRVTYFVPDERKDGGAFREITGRIRKMDTVLKRLQMEDGTEIETDWVVDLEEETAQCRQHKEDRIWE